MPTSLYPSDTLNLACLFVGILCDSEEWKTYQFCLSNSSSTTSDKKKQCQAWANTIVRSESLPLDKKVMPNLRQC